MAECKFQLRLTIVGLLLVALGTLEYTMAATASNVALGKPATQTDTAGEADPSRAVDGSSSTCAETASPDGNWTIDLNNYYNIEEVSIHAEPVSEWVTSAVAHSTLNPQDPLENVIGVNNSVYWVGGAWIEVTFAKKEHLSRVDIYEYLSSHYAGVGEIKCYVDGGWETIWSTTAIRSLMESGSWRTFSPNLTKSCFSNRFNLTKANGPISMVIDAVNIHGTSEPKSYTIKMGLTHGKNEAEGITKLSSNSKAIWSADNTGPYRYMTIHANPKNETLKLCEVLALGHLQQRNVFKVATGIAMSNTPISTVFNVLSNSECAVSCLHLKEPACVTAQFDKATKSCALYNVLEHTRDPSNVKITIVSNFAAHLFAN